jgi:hypothetical protein
MPAFLFTQLLKGDQKTYAILIILENRLPKIPAI